MRIDVISLVKYLLRAGKQEKKMGNSEVLSIIQFFHTRWIINAFKSVTEKSALMIYFQDSF